jgi:DNA-directed RNA polymerase subunit RPC12/RpoP
MENQLSCHIKENSGVLLCTLSGTITEKSDLNQILERNENKVIIDLGGIDNINSGGVGNWVTFVSKFTSPPREVFLEHCPAVIVRQLNMISNMSGLAKIRSVMVPYICSNCGKEKQTSYNLENTDPKSIPTKIKCADCNDDMDLDDILEVYFGFVRNK